MKILTVHEFTFTDVNKLHITREISINTSYIELFTKYHVEATEENIAVCIKKDINVESHTGKLGVEIKLTSGEKIKAIEPYEYVKKILTE